jgi:hypothetical protein
MIYKTLHRKLKIHKTNTNNPETLTTLDTQDKYKQTRIGGEFNIPVIYLDINPHSIMTSCISFWLIDLIWFLVPTAL